MCKMNVVLNKIVLGNRELGWQTWDGKQVAEFTSKQLKDIIKAGKQKVCGLKIGSGGELELDAEGFFTTNMMVYSHIGNWKPMVEDSMLNLLYVCIGSRVENGKTMYECISSRFEQLTISEEEMKVYLKMGVVSGGAKMDGDKVIVASLELEKKAVVGDMDTEEVKKNTNSKTDENRDNSKATNKVKK